MSDDDKIAIIGKLHLEHVEAMRHGAFIREELAQVVKAFDALIASLRARANYSTGTKVDVQTYATKYSDLSKLVTLVEEQDETARRAEDIRKKLAELGALRYLRMLPHALAKPT